MARPPVARRWPHQAVLALAWAAATFSQAAALRNGRSQQGQHAASPEGTALLLISSPSARKVGYLELSELSGAAVGTPRPLLESGLSGPSGLAFDAASGKLYVADPPSQRVVCYPLQVRQCTASDCQHKYEVAVGGSQVVVVEGVLASWVAVDGEGNLYFTDSKAMTVNRVNRFVLDRLSSRALTSSDLTTVPELQLSALSAAASNAPTPAGRERALAALDQRLQSAIVSLHQATQGPNVDTPGGVASDGRVVYWTNQARGTSKGALAAGSASVSMAAAGAAQKTMALSNATDAAYGVVSTFDKVLFTGATGLYSVGKSSRATTTASEALLSPKGLAWDGDNTVYVADAGGNLVYSLSSGREGPNQPLQQIASFPGPFGLALARVDDVQKLLDRTAAADSATASAEWWSSFWSR